MLTQQDYCDYETSVSLKELGYDELCDGYYHLTDDEEYDQLSFNWCYGRDFQNSLDRWRVGVPMLYEAQKWLREHRNIDVLPRRGYNNRQRYQVEIYIYYNRNIMLLDNDGEDYNSPEEALSKGIKEAVKILKEE